jgi:L-serine dehydratase
VNPITFQALDSEGNTVNEYVAWSVGGGSVVDKHNLDNPEEHYDIYNLSKFSHLREWCASNGKALWEYVFEREPELFSPAYNNDTEDVNGYLWKVWAAMKNAINEGLSSKEECVPGPIKLKRRAKKIYTQSKNQNQKKEGNHLSRSILMAFTLAVA